MSSAVAGRVSSSSRSQSSLIPFVSSPIDGGANTKPVSSSKQRDANLRLQRDRFVGFAFAGGNLLIETDLDGRITYVAGAAQTISGQSIEEMTGRYLTDLVLPDLATVAEQFLRDLADHHRATPCRIGFDGDH